MGENPFAIIEESIKEALKVVNLTSQYTSTGLQSCIKSGRVVQVVFEYIPSTISHEDVLIPKLPKVAAPLYLTIGMNNGQCIPCYLANVAGQDYARLIVYYPGTLTPARIDATITYIAE